MEQGNIGQKQMIDEIKLNLKMKVSKVPFFSQCNTNSCKILFWNRTCKKCPLNSSVPENTSKENGADMVTCVQN